MNWTKWKMGLLVSCATGFFSAFITGAIFPNATVRELAFVLIGSVGKDFLLYIKDHPIDSVDTTTFVNPDKKP